MNVIKKAGAILLAVCLSVAAPFAMAVADTNVTAAISAAQTGFTDSFGSVATLFVTISVTIALVLMAVRWFRRAAK